MKKELEKLMEKHGYDGMLITGPAGHNPAMFYFLGPVHVGHGDLIVKKGCEPLVFYNPMEREEAAKAGYPSKNLAEYKLNELVKEYGGDYVKATAARYKMMFEDSGLTEGRVVLYGKSEVGAQYAVYSELQKMMPGMELVGEVNDAMLLEAMATKDEDEAVRMRAMADLTMEVVGRTWDLLAGSKVKDETLYKTDGQPLTIGDVKSKINTWIVELGAENPHGTIFAIGRDAGIPHSTGTSSDVIRLGQTIVYDIFPCEAGGGYHHDFTRTWCVGYAPDEELKLYEDVKYVFDKIMEELKIGEACEIYQARTCELFKELGHATIADDPTLQEGYVHSLGHGLGLNLHERPFFRKNGSPDDRLDPGVVVTIEPGLYYPSKGMGCRIEDSVYITPDGKFETLSHFRKDLVIPIKK